MSSFARLLRSNLSWSKSIRPKPRRLGFHRARLESLETRQVFAAPTLEVLPNVTLLAGAPLHIPLDGFDADGDALTYTVESTNAAVATLIPNGNRSLKLSVSHASSGASDPAFSGDMVLQLFEDRAPRATSRIIQLAQSGFYNGVIFHRVINGFMIQGGDPTGTGSGGSTLGDFDDQFHPDLQHTGVGLLSMAKSGDDTNDSQFFITETPQRSLDFNHTVFGRLVEGDNIREQISNVPTNATNKPLGTVTITSATVFVDTQNRVLTIKAPPGTTGTSSIKVTADDGHGGIVERTFTVTLAADTTNNTPFLNDISDVVTTTGTPVTFQLPATDVEGNPIFYFNHAPAQDANLTVSVIASSGVTTVTPKPGFAGVASFLVYVTPNQNATGPFDTQFIPVLVNPSAPSSIDLVAATDSGASNSDRLTRFDNSSPTETLQFVVSGVTSGRTVQLFDGTTLIGEAVAAGTTVTITTNGTAALAAGSHAITAKQVMPNQALEVGNRDETVTLTSAASTALNIKVGSDWQNPADAMNVDNTGDVLPLDALIIINRLNGAGAGPLGPTTPGGDVTYYDVDGNGSVQPLDALIIINHLNELAGAAAQQSASAAAPLTTSATSTGSTASAVAVMASAEPTAVATTLKPSISLPGLPTAEDVVSRGLSAANMTSSAPMVSITPERDNQPASAIDESPKVASISAAGPSAAQSARITDSIFATHESDEVATDAVVELALRDALLAF